MCKCLWFWRWLWCIRGNNIYDFINSAKYKISYAQVEDTNIIDENKTIVLAGTVPHTGLAATSRWSKGTREKDT